MENEHDNEGHKKDQEGTGSTPEPLTPGLSLEAATGLANAANDEGGSYTAAGVQALATASGDVSFFELLWLWIKANGG